MTACNKTMSGSYKEMLAPGRFFEMSFDMKSVFYLLNTGVQTADDIPASAVFIF